MNENTTPDERTGAIYDAIDAFQRTHRLPGLQHAQIRGLLAEHLARALPAVSAVRPPATDRTALVAERDALGREADRLRKDWVEMRTRAERAEADRAAVLREAADHLEAVNPDRGADFSDGVDWAVDELRRLAAEPAAAGPDQTDETQGESDFTESVIYEVVGDWGVDSADSAEGARAAVAKWLRAYPKCGAHAQQRIYRDWPDGSEWYGPWTDLPAVGGAQQQTEARP